VVVGQLGDATETTLRAYAVDLSLDPPVVDLLPVPLGVWAYAQRINDSGDIAGIYQVSFDDKWGVPKRSVWHFNPGLYGHFGSRLARQVDNLGLALPVDLTTAEYTLPFDETDSLSFWRIDLNEPDFETGRPAQIMALMDATVRHTISDPIVDPNQELSPVTETFPELSYIYHFNGINADGTFAAESAVYTGKGNKTEVVNHVYSSELIQTPVDPDVARSAGINDDGQVVYDNGALFGNWNDGYGDRIVYLDELVIGSEVDVIEWDSHAKTVPEWTSGQSVIAGRFLNDDNSFAGVFILTEESVSQ
jgi:hypothetical protein